MQRFYSSMVDYYDQIFPLNKKQLAFALAQLKPKSKILDVGCAIGQLSIAMGQENYCVTGIDLSEKMIAAAEQRARRANVEVDFLQADMTRLSEKFERESFDRVLCFGNTLVHLVDAEQRALFLEQAFEHLSPGGMLKLQIINYDRVLRDNVRSLPTIENDAVRFDRIYSSIANNGVFDFQTRLLIKNSGELLENSIKLYALSSRELIEALERAGFKNIEIFGSIKEDPFTASSYPLVVNATRDLFYIKNPHS